MPEFVALKMSRDEYHTLVRLVGHHTCGDGLESVYSRLVELRPIEAAIAENMGPLCNDHPIAAKDIYGDRPVVRVNA